MLLTALMVAKDLHKRVHFVPFVLLRWIRFAIPLVGVIVFHKCASLAGSGPFFSSSILDTVMGGCADHQWWQGLLFVQNWFDLSDTVNKNCAKELFVLNVFGFNFFLSASRSVGSFRLTFKSIWLHLFWFSYWDVSWSSKPIGSVLPWLWFRWWFQLACCSVECQPFPIWHCLPTQTNRKSSQTCFPLLFSLFLFLLGFQLTPTSTCTVGHTFILVLTFLAPY